MTLPLLPNSARDEEATVLVIQTLLPPSMAIHDGADSPLLKELAEPVGVSMYSLACFAAAIHPSPLLSIATLPGVDICAVEYDRVGVPPVLERRQAELPEVTVAHK